MRSPFILLPFLSQTWSFQKWILAQAVHPHLITSLFFLKKFNFQTQYEVGRKEIKAVSVFHQSAFFSSQLRPLKNSREIWKVLLGTFFRESFSPAASEGLRAWNDVLTCNKDAHWHATLAYKQTNSAGLTHRPPDINTDLWELSVLPACVGMHLQINKQRCQVMLGALSACCRLSDTHMRTHRHTRKQQSLNVKSLSCTQNARLCDCHAHTQSHRRRLVDR